MEFFEILLAQDSTTSRREAQQQNSARLAFFRHTHGTNGVGPVRMEEPILFDIPFLERPSFTQGALVKAAPDVNIWHMPVGTAGVWQWRRNIKGHYLGAFMYFEVRMETRSGAVLNYPPVEMLHDLVFTGIAYKNLGDAVTTEAQLLEPRPVDYGAF